MSDATSDKRPAEGGDEPSAKRLASETTSNSPTTACNWGGSNSGGFAAAGGGCSWGSGGVSFSSISAGGSGFAAVASSGGGFDSATQSTNDFGSALTSAGFGQRAPSAFTSFGACTPGSTTAVESAPVLNQRVEQVPNSTGEEDEECIHKCRAKLFRLEVRMERRRITGPRPREDGTGETDASGKCSPLGTAAVHEEKKTSNGSPGAAAEQQAPPLNTSGGGGGTEDSVTPLGDSSGDKGVSAVTDKEGVSPGKGGEAEGEGDGDDEDDDYDDGEEAKPSEDCAGGEEVEVTKWAEKGVGQVRLLVPKQAVRRSAEGGCAYPRLVMRVEHVGRLILNQPLPPATAPAERVSDTSIRLVVVSAATGATGEASPQVQVSIVVHLSPHLGLLVTRTCPYSQSYLFRVKTPAEAEMLFNQINASIAPADPPDSTK